MPYSADLRCSYARTEINKDWFLHFLEEDMEMEITFEDDLSEALFWRELENVVNDYIRDKVFWGAAAGKSTKFDEYENVWQFLADWVNDMDTLAELKDCGYAFTKKGE